MAFARVYFHHTNKIGEDEGNEESEHTVTLFSKGRVVKAWDAQSGTRALVESTQEGGHLTVQLKMHPYETRLLVVR